MKARHNLNWTAEEIEYLEENYGSRSIEYIASYLDRTVGAVVAKAHAMGMGAVLDNGDYISFNQLLLALHIQRNRTSTIKKWGAHDFPWFKKKVINSKFLCVRIKDFWKWAEQHQELVDFSRLEENILGVEPAWVKQKRHDDFNRVDRKGTWSNAEIIQLKSMLLQGRSYRMIGDALHRSTGSVKKKAYSMGLNNGKVV